MYFFSDSKEKGIKWKLDEILVCACLPDWAKHYVWNWEGLEMKNRFYENSNLSVWSVVHVHVQGEKPIAFHSDRWNDYAKQPVLERDYRNLSKNSNNKVEGRGWRCPN